jgi:hypothetical protein
MLIERIRPTRKRWKHDRKQTVGASEVGSCIRQVWYNKHGYPEERAPSWGPATRGNVIEAWARARLRAAGFQVENVQRTLIEPPLSATLDMTIDGMPVDLKSFDPRIADPVRQRHRLQLQVQMGLTGAARGLLLYVNASDFSDLREAELEAEPATFKAMQARAATILNAAEPPEREGRWTGDCRWCPFQAECLGRPIAGEGMLNEDDQEKLRVLRDCAGVCQSTIEHSTQENERLREQAHEVLRRADVTIMPGVVSVQNNGILRWIKEKEKWNS